MSIDPAAGARPAGTGGRCCHRDDLVWAYEELLVVTLHGGVLSTDSVDALPPGSARILVPVCVLAGARLEQGTLEQLMAAADEAARRAPGAGGWWRAALGFAAPGLPPDRRGVLMPATWKLSNAPRT